VPAAASDEGRRRDVLRRVDSGLERGAALSPPDRAGTSPLQQQLREARSELSEEEKAALARWDHPFWYTNQGGLGPFRTPGKATTEVVRANGKKFVVDVEKVEALFRHDRGDVGGYKIDKKMLKGAVRSAMAPLFGKPAVSGPLWEFRTAVGSLTASRRPFCRTRPCGRYPNGIGSTTAARSTRRSARPLRRRTADRTLRAGRAPR